MRFVSQLYPKGFLHLPFNVLSNRGSTLLKRINGTPSRLGPRNSIQSVIFVKVIIRHRTVRDSCAPRRDGRGAIRDRLTWWDKISQLVGSARSGRTRYVVEWFQYRWTNNRSGLWSQRQGAHDQRRLARCEALRHVVWMIFQCFMLSQRTRCLWNTRNTTWIRGWVQSFKHFH
jgi:hypothetical protein